MGIDGPEVVYMTVEQYFALDEATDGKYEYIDGVVYMLRPPSSVYMDEIFVGRANGSVVHAALCARVAMLVDVALGDSACVVYGDVRVKLGKRRYLYADVAVSCEQERGAMLTEPTAVVEVLSKMTEGRDRGVKFDLYKILPSVQEYVLIGSEYRVIEVYRREGEVWRQYSYGESDVVELVSVGVSFSFDAVYRRIDVG